MAGLHLIYSGLSLRSLVSKVILSDTDLLRRSNISATVKLDLANKERSDTSKHTSVYRTQSTSVLTGGPLLVTSFVSKNFGMLRMTLKVRTGTT